MRCSREEADSLTRLLPRAGAVIPDAALGERRGRYRGVMEVPRCDGSFPDHKLLWGILYRVLPFLPALLESFPSSIGTFTFRGQLRFGVSEVKPRYPVARETSSAGKEFPGALGKVLLGGLGQAVLTPIGKSSSRGIPASGARIPTGVFPSLS